MTTARIITVSTSFSPFPGARPSETITSLYGYNETQFFIIHLVFQNISISLLVASGTVFHSLMRPLNCSLTLHIESISVACCTAETEPRYSAHVVTFVDFMCCTLILVKYDMDLMSVVCHVPDVYHEQYKAVRRDEEAVKLPFIQRVGLVNV